MKDIEGFEGRFAVTEDGRIWSHNQQKFIPTLKTNYEYVSLWKNGKTHKISVHRLVAKAFVKNEQYKPVVDHIDNNKFNNMASNLQWVTTQENVHKSYSQLSPVRNFTPCKLYHGEVFVDSFSSLIDCAKYASTHFGASYSSLLKHRASRGYTIKV